MVASTVATQVNSPTTERHFKMTHNEVASPSSALVPASQHPSEIAAVSCASRALSTLHTALQPNQIHSSRTLVQAVHRPLEIESFHYRGRGIMQLRPPSGSGTSELWTESRRDRPIASSSAGKLICCRPRACRAAKPTRTTPQSALDVHAYSQHVNHH